MRLPVVLAAIVAVLSSAALRAQTPAAPNLRVTNDVRIYQMDKDAVVNISSTRIVNAQVGTGDPVFDRFFGGTVRAVPSQSLGSGFVIHSAGYIVTNEHVIDQAMDVQVVLSDGTKLDAQVLATDNEHDLAVLKVTPKKPLQAIVLGASEDLMIGEPVYAIGNPFGYSGSMTRGIVSAVDRTLEFGPNKSYKNLIQTDASINPGNSGGPLLNAYGQVIGINTAIRGDAHGIGFAISVSKMRDLLPGFLNSEVLNRAQLGFSLEERRTIKPPADVSAEVIVKEASAAAVKAGLRADDHLLAVNGVTVNNIVDAAVNLMSAKAGDTVTLRIARGGKAHEVKVAVTQAPPPESERILAAKLGIEAKTVTPALAKAEKLATTTGVLITKVLPKSAADAASLKPGDVLYQLGPYYVNTVEDAAALLKTAKGEIDVRIGIIRNGARGRGVVRLGGAHTQGS